MQELKEQLDSLTIGQSNCTECTGGKKLDTKYLNEYQKKVYHDICEFLQQKSNAIIMIDTPSGSGKTFLLCTLAANYHKRVKLIIFRKDQASEISLKNIQTYTFISFSMRHFNLPYRRAIQMFRTYNEDKILELYKLIVYSKKFVAEDTSVLILDIYTIPSPAMLLLLYILSLEHKLHLIFAGNAMQLNPINKSVFHKENNYYIIQILRDLTISELNKNMRTCDTVLRDKVACFYKLLQQVQPTGNVPLNYNLRYHLYTLFRSKYFTEERFDTVYIAQTHRNIKTRLHRFIKHLRSICKAYYEAPFYYSGKDGILLPVPYNDKGKFFPTLLLVQGYKYIYVTEAGVHHVVLLQNILFENNEIMALEICFLRDKNRVETIQRIKLNYYQILPAYRDWLLQNDKCSNEGDIWQFSLRPYTLTYHAALGRTIDKEQVELSTECLYANFLYVGLCSVRHDSDIHKIHDERNLAGYLVTEYMETVRKDTTYYYRCQLDKREIYEDVVNKQPIEYIDNIEWSTLSDVHTFEKISKGYVRIERSAYKKESNKKVDTPFMQITKFVKENPNVILNTIKMARVDDFSGDNNNKNKKKKKKVKEQRQENEEDKKSVALSYLHDEYDRWVVKKEMNLRE